MTFLDAIILGIVQGLTEFLPISSSGHLVIGEALLGLSSPGMSLEIWLHFGTLMAVVVYFRHQLFQVFGSVFGIGEEAGRNKNRTIFWAIVMGTIPAVIVGLLFKSSIEMIFDSPRFAAWMLMVTGIILFSTRMIKPRDRKINIPRGLIIGIAQSIAILPGISRSGSTISCAMYCGINPSLAAEFSFLLAVPIIAAAFGYDLLFSGADLFSSQQIVKYMAGTVVSFFVGLLAIHLLLGIIRTGKFYMFGFYCLVAGVISLILLN
jgi:undecaprenyl-diphosphatase